MGHETEGRTIEALKRKTEIPCDDDRAISLERS